jgi:DnaJ homolog subfamily C member 7
MLFRIQEGTSTLPSPTAPEPTPPPSPSEPESAETIKERGNVAFRAGKFHDAIDLYTKAIGDDQLSSFLVR